MSTTSSRSTSVGPIDEENKQGWVQETAASATKEKRQQPWKKTFGDQVDCRFDDGPDLVAVEDREADHPFHVLSNSVAA